MKSIITFLLFSIFCFAQTAEFNNLNKEGKFEEYISEAGISFKVGDKVKIGLPGAGNRYNFITQGNEQCGTAITGKTVTISKIRVIGTKKKGFICFLLFSGYGLSVYIHTEPALQTNELILLEENTNQSP